MGRNIVSNHVIDASCLLDEKGINIGEEWGIMDAKRGAISNRANGRLSRINREKREREREIVTFESQFGKGRKSLTSIQPNVKEHDVLCTVSEFYSNIWTVMRFKSGRRIDFCAN